MICANILLYLNIHLARLKNGKDQRCIVSYMEATTLWMLYLFLATEILSCIHGINQVSLWGVWVVLDLLLAACLYRRTRGNIKRSLWQCFPLESLRKHKPVYILLLIGLWALILAFSTVPYNWDSMTYRLSRVAYWAQNGSVEHFATNCTRALANPPLGEFVQLHVYVMTGKNDALLNLMQAFSYLIGTAIVYAIAKRLKCKDMFCFLSALLFMSMPIAFAEALNTQVDLLSGIWLLIFVYLLMDFMDREEKLTCSFENIFKVCCMGLCVAWGYLTKPSVCVAMLLFVIWLLIRCIVRRDKLWVLLRLAFCALGSMILPIGWEISRNLQTYHAISAPIAGARQLVGTLQPNYLLINFLKNFTYNLPCTWFKGLSDKMLSVMWQLSTKLGVFLNAESISEDGRQFAYMATPNYAHDTAINPIIVWLLVICSVLALLQIRRRNFGQLYRSYSLCVFVTFGVFCVILRWEPFVTRYMLPFLALLCPAIALQLQKALNGRVKPEKWVIGLVSLVCVVDLIGMSAYHYDICTTYGVGARPYGYFTNRSTEYEAVRNIVEYVQEQGYEEIGMYHGEDDYEYPYWAMLKKDVSRIEHVGMVNESLVYADMEYRPQCIIWYGAAPAEVFVWNGQSYPKVVEMAENRYVLTTEE